MNKENFEKDNLIVCDEKLFEELNKLYNRLNKITYLIEYLNIQNEICKIIINSKLIYDLKCYPIVNQWLLIDIINKIESQELLEVYILFDNLILDFTNNQNNINNEEITNLIWRIKKIINFIENIILWKIENELNRNINSNLINLEVENKVIKPIFKKNNIVFKKIEAIKYEIKKTIEVNNYEIYVNEIFESLEYWIFFNELDWFDTIKETIGELKKYIKWKDLINVYIILVYIIDYINNIKNGKTNDINLNEKKAFKKTEIYFKKLYFLLESIIIMQIKKELKWLLLIDSHESIWLKIFNYLQPTLTLKLLTQLNSQDYKISNLTKEVFGENKISSLDNLIINLENQLLKYNWLLWDINQILHIFIYKIVIKLWIRNKLIDHYWRFSLLDSNIYKNQTNY